VVDLAVGIVGLDGEGPLAEPAAGKARGSGAALGLGVVDRDLAVHTDDDAPALHRDVVVEPLAVGARGLLPNLRIAALGYVRALLQDGDVLQPVETAGVPGIPVGRVPLALVALLGPALRLQGGVEVDPAVRTGQGFGAHLQLEVLELRSLHLAGVEEVALSAL